MRGARGGNHRLLWAVAVAVVGGVVGCSTASHQSAPTTIGYGGAEVATSTSTTTGAPTTVTTTPTAAATSTTAASSSSFAAVTGTYVAGTADGGWLYIRSDGASRFRSPDDVACPNCITASAPIASLDFSLTSITSTAAHAFHAVGTVTETSDPTWAKQLSPGATVGSAVSITIASGHLTANLFSGTLSFSSKSALYTSVSPCTVAAVSGPVAAADVSQTQKVTGVTCSSDGEWAAASVAVGQGAGGFDSVGVLAGNGATWVVVDRPTVCNNHDVTPSFYNTACGSN
ncbi:MAG TPA: hypothetical protein VHT30_01640 [Acidimicrobiales bacterium]|jgi:hypothetical protein|nr:hypothetical protein [Acidimicrobiales bacterium]